MSLQQLHCPSCSGLFQVDQSMAGTTVSCPHCTTVVMVPASTVPQAPPEQPFGQPDMAIIEPDFPPAPHQPPPTNLPPQSGPPPASGANLACPHCTGVFQIDPSMEGQQVLCPLCNGQVVIPHSGNQPAGVSPISQPQNVAPTQEPSTAVQPESPQIPASVSPPSSVAPSSVIPSSVTPSPQQEQPQAVSSILNQISNEQKEIKAAASNPVEAPQAPNPLFPPGMEPKAKKSTSATDPQTPPVKEPVEEKAKSTPRQSQPAEKKICLGSTEFSWQGQIED